MMRMSTIFSSSVSYDGGGTTLLLSGQSKSKEELIGKLYNSLQYQISDARNWDALLDCLRDFENIDGPTITILHDSIPINGNNAENINYMKVLTIASLFWVGKEKNLIVLFPDKLANEIVEWID